MRIPWRARLPWFAVWVPVALLLYTLVNGAGHVRIAYAVMMTENRPPRECDFVLRVAAYLYGPWGFLIVPVLLIFAYVSWKLCPQWSSSVRWMAGMLGFLLCILLLLAQVVLLCPRGWDAGSPTTTELRVCAVQLWKPHFCRPVPELDWYNPSMVWKARASDIAVFMEDADSKVRAAAAETLVDLGEKSVAPQIAKFLEDADPNVRWKVVETLGRLGEKSIAPQLVKLLEDPHPNVVEATARALWELSGETWSNNTLEASARAWWAQHKDDPEWNPK